MSIKLKNLEIEYKKILIRFFEVSMKMEVQIKLPLNTNKKYNCISIKNVEERTSWLSDKGTIPFLYYLALTEKTRKQRWF